MGSAAMYVHIQSSCGHTFHFFRKMPSSTVTGSDGKFMFHFLRICKLYYEVTALCYIPISNIGGSLISLHSPTFVVVCLFGYSHSIICEITSHCGFNWKFSDDSWYQTSFHVFIHHSNTFGEMSIQIYPPFKTLGCCLIIELLVLYVLQ